MEEKSLFHPAFNQQPLPGGQARAAGDQQVPGRCPSPAVAAVATHMTAAPGASCTFCMRLWGWKGLGWGRAKRAVSISSHFCRNHQHTPPPRDTILQSLYREGAGDGPRCAGCCPGLAPGEQKVRMLDCCWAETGQVPSPFVPILCLPGGPDSGLGALLLLAGKSKDRSPHRGPAASRGLSVGSGMRGKRGRREGGC